ADHQYDGYFGPTTIGETIAQFYGWDMLVHRWDIAQAMGRDAALSETELDEIGSGLAGFDEALYAPGICKLALDVDPDAPKLVKVMALLGRNAS
ncbi:MAG: TIGR03086 family protein, partial [Ornithinimicrobium sp.]